MKVTLEQQQQGQELLQTLVSKAWESAAFKEQLISNPQKTISEVTGREINIPNQKIVVEDQMNPSVIYLNIPRQIDLGELELSDEQLEMVAGGTDAMFWTGVGIGLALVSLATS